MGIFHLLRSIFTDRMYYIILIMTGYRPVNIYIHVTYHKLYLHFFVAKIGIFSFSPVLKVQIIFFHHVCAISLRVSITLHLLPVL